MERCAQGTREGTDKYDRRKKMGQPLPPLKLSSYLFPSTYLVMGMQSQRNIQRALTRKPTRKSLKMSA